MSDCLSGLLALPEGEKINRGILHTPQEIAQQPETWLKTFRIVSDHKEEISRFLKPVLAEEYATVFVVGAGSSDYVGQALQHSLRAKWHCEVIPAASTDLLTHFESFHIPGRPYLWISFSRSGDSSEAIAAIQAALDHRPDVRHLIISCNQNGRLLRDFAANPHIHSLVLDDAVNDRGLAMTSSFTNMLIAGQCLANLESLSEYELSLGIASQSAKRVMGRAADLAAKVATKQCTKVCFLGSGPLKAIARESALKVLELTAGRISTFWESSLGLRHGPLSAVDNRTILVSYISSDPSVQGYETDLLNEISEKKLGPVQIAVSPTGNLSRLSANQYCLPLHLPEYFPDDCCAMIDVTFGQLLALFLSIRNGIHPDTPSPSGAISRVVSEVRVYKKRLSRNTE